MTTSKAADPIRPTGPRKKASLASGAMSIGVVNLLKVGLQLALLPVMARLLGPTEFGLYALALPTVAFVALLADGGLGATLAREVEDSSPIWSTAFWLLLVMGVSLALLVSGWGVILGSITKEPRLSGIMAVLSISFVMLTMSVSPGARLMRRGSLIPGAIGDLISNVVGAVVAVSLALRGAGAWSLAIQYTSSYFVRAVVLNAAAFEIPRFEFNISTLSGHISAAKNIIGSRLSDFTGRIFENILFNKYFGGANLGAFTFSNQVPRFITESVSNPVWASLYVHALRGDRSSSLVLHRNLCRLLGAILFPVALIVSASSPQLIVLLLGPKWSLAAPMLSILLPSYVISVMGAQSGPMLTAYGGTSVLLRAAFFLSVARVASVALGLWIGTLAVAVCIAIANVGCSLLLTIWAEPITEIKLSDVAKVLLGPSLASVLAGMTTWSVLHFGAGGWLATITAMFLGGVVYLLAFLAIDWRLIQSDIQTVQRLLGRAKVAT